jgi:putative cell wall binding repeat protein
MSVRRTSACVLGLVLALAGCGGGGGSPPPSRTPPPATPAPSATGAAPQGDASLGFPVLATKNTTRVAGADPVADAAGVAQAVFPAGTPESHPQAVVLAGRNDWQAAISAAQLMSRPLRAPLLLADGDALPAASAAALDALQPTGAKALRGAQVVRVGTSADPAGRLARDVTGTGPAALAAAVDRLHARLTGGYSDAVLVASSERPGYAMPAAGWAAKSGDPVLWTGRDALPASTRAALRAHGRPDVYVLGPRSAVSPAVVKALRPLSGGVQRIAGEDPMTSAIAFARYSHGRFGWNVTDPGHGLVVASTGRPLDAAAGAALSASGTYGPLLLVTDAAGLPVPLQDYLLDIQPGYDPDPVRGVYNHGWLLGDESAISAAVQARIDTLLEIQPVDTGAE